jgi:hypothetical protein
MVVPSLNAIAKALGGDINDRDVLCPGPGHSPVDRSLSVRPDASAPDGFLVHSFCGDDPIVCKDFVRDKLGLGPFEPNRKAGNGGDRAWNVVAEHVYRDERGAPYLRVRRCLDGKGRKQYPQSHWTGTAWVSGEPDGPKLPIGCRI